MLAMLFASIPSLAAAQHVSIDHAAVSCVVSGRLPELTSAFDPADNVAQARVYFRAGGTPHWYYVPMTRDGGAFKAVLPKPLDTTKSVEYYVEAVDKAAEASRSAEYSAQVVPLPAACGTAMKVASIAAAAKVLVGVPAGTSGLALVPAGFAADGVAAAAAAGVAATGGGSSGAGAAAGAAASGGGIGATTLVLGGVAVAGAATAVAVKRGGDSDSGDDGAGMQHVQYSVNFLASTSAPGGPGMNVSACAGRPVFWSSQSIVADPSGNFDTVWSPSEPNTLRVRGSVTANTFSATLGCASGGSASGSFSANGSGGTYNGTYEFAGATGTVQIFRR
jgi:hypothetical protein